MSAVFSCGIGGCAGEPETGDVLASVSADGLDPKTITAPAGTWTWINVPGAVCGNGSATGFGINVGTSSDMLIYLEGGGVCWDEPSCRAGIAPGAQLASYFLTGYTQTDFNAWSNAPPGIFNRNQTNNPYKNATIVYVPYCTGDFHVGSRTQTWNTVQPGYVAHFAGRQNLELYLNEIVPSFPNVGRITLAGSSAGGFGATINYWRVRQAFGGNKRVDLVADSAPMFPQNYMLNHGWASWDLTAALPPACGQACRDVYSAIYTHYGNTYPDSSFSFLSFNADQQMMIGTVQTPQAFQDSLGQLVWDRIRPLSNWRYLVPDGTTHTMLYALNTAAGPRILGDWLGLQRNDDPSWASRTTTGTHCKDGNGKVNGASEVKYIGMGACSSFLGAPTSVTADTSDNHGRKTFFQNGAIWSHPTYGQWEVHGPILTFWASKGYEASGYGYPRTDQEPTAASNGVKSTFGGGGIFSSPTTGTYGVVAGIWSKYKALGADASVLGLPMSGEIATGFLNADRKQEFQYGWIYWNPTSGATYWMK